MSRAARAADGRAGRRPGEHGQVLVIFVLALVALMAAAGLAIDIGRFYSERRFLQNAADAAALAAANTLIAGKTSDAARTEALAVIARNFQIPPNGITPSLPPPSGSEVYQAGQAGSPSALIDGILIDSSGVRVAVRNTVPYTFGRAAGFTSQQIYARARVSFRGNLLPIAVRNFVKAPGSNTGTAPCTDNQTKFMDFFSTANTACVGTDTNATNRVQPNAGAAFSSANPDNDRTNHGPVIEILGQGAQPGNGADFRGFVALDVRNYLNSTSQLYYNDVPSGVTSSVLKDLAARWIYTGGYPGPALVPVTSPPDSRDQIGLLFGNSTGAAVTAVTDRFQVGDTILVLVYSGLTQSIPDFTMNSPSAMTLPTTGTTNNVGNFKIGRNQSFSGQVALSTVGDAGDPQNPLTNGTLTGATPLTYSPNPVTPAQGQGTSVGITNAVTVGATTGIYTLWLKGQAGSPYLTTKYFPMAVQVGSVQKDFTFTAPNGSEALAPTLGSSATFTLNLKAATNGNNAFNTAGINLSVEAYPEGTMPAGIGSVSFSNATPLAGQTGQGTTVTLTIGAGSLPEGQYPLVVRATGVNADGYKVTHLLPITLSVVTGSSNSNTSYVDVTGYGVMRLASFTSNTIYAYAISPVITDPNDSRLRLGQVARLVAWN
ncbi:MAG TPA: pilus assembly protein TadG-related protein [Candidatus Limnocylindrales bacterium]|nr:pilus assembly protein TadG-related protein [Candidatus Limnocylindrales bacterium]